jgi:hypothetical protein
METNEILEQINFKDVLAYVMEQCSTISDDDAYREDTQMSAIETYESLARLKNRMNRDDEDQYVRGEND